jgi:hypothetical protein
MPKKDILAVPWRRWVGLARTLFVTLVILDLVLLLPPLAGLARSADRGNPQAGATEGLWAFLAVALALVATTVFIWCLQAWLASRTIAIAITSEMVSLLERALDDAQVAATRRTQLSIQLRRELDSTLSMVEYRPLARVWRRQRVKLRGNVLVTCAVAKAVLSAFGKRVVPECAKRLDTLPAEWLKEQPEWSAAPEEDRRSAEASITQLRLLFN